MLCMNPWLDMLVSIHTKNHSKTLKNNSKSQTEYSIPGTSV